MPYVHGYATRSGYTKEYICWAGIVQRCNNKKCKSYPYYGGRGIKLSPKWSRFEEFLKDVGFAPSKKHSLDRINNDGNYEPGNCRWATQKEQIMNTRIRKDNKSGVKHISYNSNSKKWTVTKRLDGKQKHFGSFEDLNEAKRVLNNILNNIKK